MMIEVVEPMGMETMVYFTLAGAEVCGRVNPNAGATAEQSMKLRADLSNMHLIDDTTGKVLKMRRGSRLVIPNEVRDLCDDQDPSRSG